LSKLVSTYDTVTLSLLQPDGQLDKLSTYCGIKIAAAIHGHSGPQKKPGYEKHVANPRVKDGRPGKESICESLMN
jgi:hypothetical protein